ncbi:MAG: hypothetical protein H0W44_05300 [Gammaproteobacteria bacterium]|nr:hypothetical protein [Gammaproteobacteria bacterium]
MRVIVIFWIIFSSCAFASDWQDVRFVSNVNQENCKFIKQNVCSSIRRNGIAKCHNWHKKKAYEEGANAYVILSSASDKNITAANGNIYTDNDTSVVADYYKCPIESN